MYMLLGGFKDFLRRQPVVVDNAIFRLHYQFTTVLLLVFSVIITANQFIGNPIECINDDGVPIHVINTYCWITSTFTMPDAFAREIGSHVPHPGLANQFGDGEVTKYYTYYQWVVFILFFQAVLCYAPKWLWNMWEGKLLDTLVMGLNVAIMHEDVKTSRKKILMDYIIAHIKQHNLYALRYFFCELLCFVNIIGQLYLMDRFFDHEFLSYGLKVLEFSEMQQEDRVDPMVYVFPRVTKCTFHKFGPSGTIQRHDSMCVLSLNIFNEKSYIFIWFWFMIMAGALCTLLVYRLVIVIFSGIRPRIIHYRHKYIPYETARALTRKCGLGDFWILYMLGRNIDPLVYREIVSELSKKIETAESNM